MTKWRDRFSEINITLEDFFVGSLLGMLAFMVLAVVALMSVIGILYWIFGDHTDYGQCLNSHAEPYTTFVKSGNVMVPINSQHIVCDQWEFPGGK